MNFHSKQVYNIKVMLVNIKRKTALYKNKMY